MRFRSERFNKHLHHLGQNTVYRSSNICACISQSSGAPSTTCKLCSGKGRVWNDPQDTVIGISQQENIAELANAGLWLDGDLVATIPESSPAWLAGEYDRFTLLNTDEVFSAALVRGGVAEKITFEIIEVVRCFWRHQTTLLLVEGGLPVIGATGVPIWPNGGEPPPGATYSLSGRRRSEFYVYRNLPRSRNMHRGEELPRRIQLRRFDLFKK